MDEQWIPMEEDFPLVLSAAGHNTLYPTLAAYQNYQGIAITDMATYSLLSEMIKLNRRLVEILEKKGEN